MSQPPVFQHRDFEQKQLKCPLCDRSNVPIMQCFIYKSLKKEELYLYLDKKDDFTDVPEALFKSLSPIQFVMALELTPERKLAREDASKVLDSLKNKGFFVQMPPVVLPGSEKIQ